METGSSYFYSENQSYYGASLIKTLDALYLYDTSTINDSLKEYLKRAISNSDNDAHHYLVRTIGVQNLSEYGRELGDHNDLSTADYYGHTTVVDQMIYLKKLYELIQDHDDLKQMFINDHYNYIQLDSITTLHKYGWYGDVFHDVGIILDDQPYILIILTNYGNGSQQKEIIHELSQIMHEYHLKQ